MTLGCLSWGATSANLWSHWGRMEELSLQTLVLSWPYQQRSHPLQPSSQHESLQKEGKRPRHQQGNFHWAIRGMWCEWCKLSIEGPEDYAGQDTVVIWVGPEIGYRAKFLSMSCSQGLKLNILWFCSSSSFPSKKFMSCPKSDGKA